MLRIIIEGDRGEGATTLAIAIAQALRAEQPDFLVEYHGYSAAATAEVRRIIDGPPIPPGALHTKRVNIIDNGAVARPPRPGLAEDLAALVRNFTARLDAALRAAAVEIAANHQARRERTLRTWEQWAEALGRRGRPPLADFPPFDHTHQAVAGGRRGRSSDRRSVRRSRAHEVDRADARGRASPHRHSLGGRPTRNTARRFHGLGSASGAKGSSREPSNSAR